MTLAIVLTVFASFLWGITNHIDKILINTVDESGSSLKTLLVFSTLVSGIVLSPLWLFFSKFSINITTISLICVLLSSFLYILATYFYFIALEKNDTSIVVVMFQLIPVFSYIFELLFLKENLTTKQIIGSIIVILSAVLISFDFEEKNNKNKLLALFFMTLSSLTFSLYYFLFDLGIRNSPYNSCAFWFQIGFLLLGIIFISIKSFRTSFINALKNNGKMYFSLNLTNEIINLIAILLVNYSNIKIPLALVNVLNGFQGAFVFIIGILGMKLLPKYIEENIEKKVVVQKISCILISIIGLIVMFIN